MPVLEIAVRQLYATGVLREAEVAFRFVQRDDKCEDIEAMRCGFHLVMERRVDLFLGPVCDYGVGEYGFSQIFVAAFYVGRDFVFGMGGG